MGTLTNLSRKYIDRKQEGYSTNQGPVLAVGTIALHKVAMEGGRLNHHLYTNQIFVDAPLQHGHLQGRSNDGANERPGERELPSFDDTITCNLLG